MRKRTATDHGHTHAEAFCLMLYKCDKCGKTEWIWNSRDGVTPFIVTSRCCSGPAAHINFRGDQYAPGHTLKAGDRFFATHTRESYREAWKTNIEQNWERLPHPMFKHFASKEEALERLSADYRDGMPRIQTF